jgi:cytochrome bd-type quinol oxidase subunit 1
MTTAKLFPYFVFHSSNLLNAPSQTRTAAATQEDAGHFQSNRGGRGFPAERYSVSDEKEGSRHMATYANALVFAALGILLYGVALTILVRALPGNLWNQVIQEKSVSAGIALAGIAVGLGWIVAAAVH